MFVGLKNDKFIASPKKTEQRFIAQSLFLTEKSPVTGAALPAAPLFTTAVILTAILVEESFSTYADKFR